MLGKSVRADWKTKGFKYRVKNGVVKGKIYTAWPMRIWIAIVKTIAANVLMIVGMFAFLETPLVHVGFINGSLGVLWLGVIFFSLPYYLFLDGKPIKITSSHCTIGRKRYRLADMTCFTATTVSFKTPDQYFIEFSYGKDRKKIKVRNTFDNQLAVIETLNREIKNLINPKPAPGDMLTARSATF